MKVRVRNGGEGALEGVDIKSGATTVIVYK